MNLTRRYFRFATFAGVLIPALVTLSASPVSEPPANAILVLVDDMGYGDIAAHGNPVLKTPNFDRLRSESVRFTNFAVSPTCAATRAALLTGLHEFKSGVTHTRPPMRNMNLDATTIAELFQRAGFTTGLFGKWHLGQSDRYGPWFRGFDQTLTVPNDSQDSHFNPSLLENRKLKEFEGYRTDILFDAAMAFIEENRDGRFFCYLPTYTPHAPLNVPEEYISPYRNIRGVNPAYCGMVAKVDKNLGRLMRKLKELELKTDTLLIVMNDNGGTFGVDVWNAGMRGRKGSALRGGTRAYAFWRWGSQFPIGDRPAMSGHVDVFPTLYELFDLDIGAPQDEAWDGDSLLALLKDPTAKLKSGRIQVHHRGRWPEPSNWAEHKYTHCSVRMDDYQLFRVVLCENSDCRLCQKIRRRDLGKGHLGYSKNVDNYHFPKHGRWALYDIAKDPYQKNDISREHPEVVKKMAEYYETWWKEVSPALETAAKR